MVALLDAGDAFTDINDDAGDLMAKNGGEKTLRIGA